MAYEQAIDKAISTHGVWKMRLRTAIGGGTLDIPPNVIRSDNHCDFGKWLYGGEICSSDRSKGHYLAVKKLHAEFHVTAAKVAELVAVGRLEEARRMMASSGEYSVVSAKLHDALVAWKSA